MHLVRHRNELDSIPSNAVLGHNQPADPSRTIQNAWLQLIGDLYGDSRYRATKRANPRADFENPRRDFRLLNDCDTNTGERSWQVASSSKDRLRGRVGTPVVNMVMTWPGAMLIGIGGK